MLYPISITIDGYIQAESLEEAQNIADYLEVFEIIVESKGCIEEIEQIEIAEVSVLDIEE